MVLRCFRWNKDGLFSNALEEPSVNPKGMEAFSPAVGPIPEGLPCNVTPRVVRSSQLWAKSCNPFGIARANENVANIAFHSTENSGEPTSYFGICVPSNTCYTTIAWKSRDCSLKLRRGKGRGKVE